MTTGPLLQAPDRARLRDARYLAAAVLLLGITGCQENCITPPDGGTDGGPDGFGDHSVPFLESEGQFFELAVAGPGTTAAKFVLTDFSKPVTRDIRYMDAHFYTLHDEWYWFRLLNGQRIPGDDSFTPHPGSFATIAEIYAWAEEQAELPLDLRWVDNNHRLYSPRFYELALSAEPRVLGAGTLLYVPARDDLARPAIWAFELEYSDLVTHDELVVFFEMVLSSVPASIGADLKWLVRSLGQEELATEMEAGQLTYFDRILRYGDITVPGEAEVYAEGITAGRLKIVRAGEPLNQTAATDILILEEIPDFLPACAGLLTAVPQTPLAHINVLARNRGIPNAYVGGILDDPNLDQLARVQAPVAVRAVAPDQVDIVPLTQSQWATWRAISGPPTLVLPDVDVSTIPYSFDLTALSLFEVDELRPLIGGKAAGFLALLEPPGVIVPELPMAITARAYREHIAPFIVQIEDALGTSAFAQSGKARFLVLEGEAAYAVRYPTESDRAYKEQLLEDYPPGTAIGDFVAAGGLAAVVRDTPLAEATLELLEEALTTHYAPFALTQGLRFRSSSTVEDIEGFNGAGLYTSNTGWLDPESGSRPWHEALRQTWASYWGAEAFEERELVDIDHLAGNMAVLVHARFDDEKERSNGVFTLTVLPDEVPGQAVLEMNAQVGALSVTNPPPGVNALPEVSLVTREDDGSVTLERLAPSSEVEEGEVVLTDAQLLEVLDSAEAVTRAWLDQENTTLLSAQRRRTLILDFEYREMDVGWPALQNGNNFGRRVVLKQARSLEPSLAGIPSFVLNHPLPRDLLARARRVERRECSGQVISLIAVDAYTDPLAFPDLGYTAVPFTSFVTIDFRANVPELGKVAGDRVSVVHLGFSSLTHPGMAEGGPWTLEATLTEGAQAATLLESIHVAGDLSATLTSTTSAEVPLTFSACDVELQFSSPEAFLERIFADALEESSE